MKADKWLNSDRWVIHVGWRNGERWSRNARWGTCAEISWDEEADLKVYESAGMADYPGYEAMHPRPLVKVIERLAQDGYSPLGESVVYRLVNLMTGEVIPWDALQ